MSSPMLTSDFDYHLPPEMIAQTPMEPRDHSCLLTMDRVSSRVGHRRFFDLPGLLRPGDLLSSTTAGSFLPGSWDAASRQDMKSNCFF